jgi:Skp family chaperone for outer membrane proteins
MRSSERFFVFGGVLAAIALALAAQPGRSGFGSAVLASGGAAEARTGTVDVFRLIERLMDRPEMSEKRSDLVKAWEARLKAMQDELQAIRNQAQILPPSDPKLRDLSAQFEKRQQELSQAQQQGSGEVDQLASHHWVEAYTLVRAATRAVGDRMGYSIVLATRSAEEIEPKGQSYVLQELLARPVVKGSASDDLTAEVAKELKLPSDAPAADPKKK